jgi:glycine/D-amino acid oxidase-like deaminating enzyme
MWLLDNARDSGVEVRSASVVAVDVGDGAVRAVQLSSGERIPTQAFVNAAGPLVADVGRLVGVDLPVHSEVHRKVSFSDRSGVVPRDAPLMIWNDRQHLAWDSDEREALQSDDLTASLVGELAAGAHCRPDGPDGSSTVLGLWEYRTDVRPPVFPIPIDEMCPEVVMRGLATMLPAMAEYLGRMPQPYVDGGYYTKTRENRPLLGPVGPSGSFVVGALSGYGVMAAPAAGELVVRCIAGADLPGYAKFLAPDRYSDPEYGELLARMTGEGQL